jgi:hypothetical protein
MHFSHRGATTRHDQANFASTALPLPISMSPLIKRCARPRGRARCRLDTPAARLLGTCCAVDCPFARNLLRKGGRLSTSLRFKALFLAEIQIKADPFSERRALLKRNLAPFHPGIKSPRDLAGRSEA